MRAALAAVLLAACGGSIPLVDDWCEADEAAPWSCGVAHHAVEMLLPTASVEMIPDVAAVLGQPGELPTLFDGAELEARRIAGATDTLPSARTIAMLTREGRARATATLTFCVESDGTTSDVRVLRSSHNAEYDRALTAAVGRWRYAPLDACTAVTFVASLR